MMSFAAAISPLTVDILYSGFERMPNLGEEVFSKQFDVQIGGGPTATVITLKRLGVPVRYGTFLSNDMMSHIAAGLLGQNGIPYVNLCKEETASPVVVTSIVSFPEDRSFLTYDPAINEKGSSDDEIYRLLHGAKACIAVKGHDAVLRRLKEEGTIIVFDIGWQDDLSIEKIKSTLACVNIFTPNEKEALKLTGCASVRDALDKLDEYVDCAVITLGKDGCMTKLGGEYVHIPSLTGLHAVDTTGAGDNFLAGVVYGLYHDWPIIECLKMGNVTGGYSTTQLGCCKAEITLEKALTLLEEVAR